MKSEAGVMHCVRAPENGMGKGRFPELSVPKDKAFESDIGMPSFVSDLPKTEHKLFSRNDDIMRLFMTRLIFESLPTEVE